jgi:hypothetical protein
LCFVPMVDGIVLETGLRMVLRDRLGQYPVGLNVNKKGSDGLRG